jgi:hypothetical protein
MHHPACHLGIESICGIELLVQHVLLVVECVDLTVQIAGFVPQSGQQVVGQQARAQHDPYRQRDENSG